MHWNEGTIRQLCRAVVAHTVAEEIVRERARPDCTEHVVERLIARAPRVSSTEDDEDLVPGVEAIVRGMSHATE